MALTQIELGPWDTSVGDVMSNPDTFRDFIIWMCGVTDATDAPDEEAWMRVRNRVKEVAAEYVLARRDLQQQHLEQERLKAEMEAQYQGSAGQLYNTSTTGITDTVTTSAIGTLTVTTPTLTGSGIAGAK